ncbi:PEPD [Symbiodinium pilosum]|uniref:PEPD protein n=1 Tax=Symbiodinium pilosum TaxID=2952 RepID=A0A812QPE6_SYMPI|nr:PEPD [Symbiodinium pilosum]
MTGLDAKTLYDIWCYAEDDNVYPQIPNGQKFTAGDVVTLSTQDTTPPVLTIVSAESPISSDIRIKVRMDEPGTVYCNSFQAGTAYGTPTFASVSGGGFQSYVGFPLLSPNSPINTNVEVVVSGLNEFTLYDTYCAAVDASTLPTVNEMVQADILNTFPAIGQLTTLDQSPPVFTELGAKGTTENNIQVTFKCNEACRAYCRVTRSDSGETSLSVNRILKADYYADQSGNAMASATIDLARLENDVSLDLLDRGTLYDVFCWSRDEAVQYSCYAQAPSASCTTYRRNNYQDQTYVDTAFGGTPPATVTNGAGLPGGKILHVRTPDTTAPSITFVEAESTEESSITVTLQLDEPGTAYCKAYTTTQTVDAALYTALTTAPVYKNTVTNWNNIYKNFDIKVSGLTMETKYFVYCAAEDDELVEGATTIDPAPTSNNEALPVLMEASGRFTLDLTPPIITVVSIASNSETTATVTLQLDEPGTAWCTAVRDQFTPPSINQIIAASFSSTVLTAATDFTVQVQNLIRDTEYDVYCHARDRGTETDVGLSAGNPGNDVDSAHVLTTKRDIHTMGDSTPPSVVSVSPAHQQSGVISKPTFTIVFDEDIQAGSGNVVFTPQTGSPISIDITNVNSGTCAPAKLSIVLTTFTADWSSCGASSPLSTSMNWYVSFVAGVLTDSSSPAFGKLSCQHHKCQPKATTPLL